MYDYNPKTWLSLIFHSYSRQVVRTLMPALVIIGLFTWLVCYILLEKVVFHEKPFITTIAMHSLLGVVLGLFLVFRVNSAYDRWWEGRKLWGSLVNNTRNIAHKLNAFIPPEDRSRSWFIDTVSNVAMSLKNHL